MRIAENLPLGNGIRSRALWFDSLEEFVTRVNGLAGSDPQCPYRHNIATAVSVVRDGWQDVLQGLEEVYQEACDAWVQIPIKNWEWQGEGFSVDRLLVGKPCMTKKRKRYDTSPKFVRILFCGEAMACANVHNFLSKAKKLLTLIMALESRGKKVEVLLGFGGYRGVFEHDYMHGLMSLISVKKFHEHVDMKTLSSIGHSSLLRGLQFGIEYSQGRFPSEQIPKPGACDAGSGAIMFVDAYKKAIHAFTDEDLATHTEFLIHSGDIDPKGIMRKLQQEDFGTKED